MERSPTNFFFSLFGAIELEFLPAHTLSRQPQTFRLHYGRHRVIYCGRHLGCEISVRGTKRGCGTCVCVDCRTMAPHIDSIFCCFSFGVRASRVFTVVAKAASSRRHTHTSHCTYCMALHYGCSNFKMFAKANAANIIFRMHLNLFAFFCRFLATTCLLSWRDSLPRNFFATQNEMASHCSDAILLLLLPLLLLCAFVCLPFSYCDSSEWCGSNCKFCMRPLDMGRYCLMFIWEIPLVAKLRWSRIGCQAKFRAKHRAIH